MQRRNFLQLAAGLAAAPGLLSFTEETELAAHVIDNIELSTIKLRYPRLVGKNARSDVHGYGVDLEVVQLTTNQGARGWGITRDHKKLEEGKKFIKGKTVRDIFSVKNGSVAAASSFDFALYDLVGVIVGKPVYELIGKNKEPQLTNCYSGMIYFDDLEPSAAPVGVDGVIRNCQWDYEFGYRQFKLKLGRGHKWMSPAEGLKRDIDVTRMVHELFPDCDLLVDPNDRYDVPTTIKYLEGIGDIPLFWLEEPFSENVIDYNELLGWMRANGRGNTLIADGEWDPKLDLALELGAKKLLNVYLADISDIGFSGWRRLNQQLKTAGLMASPHCWGHLLKTHYTAHLVGALGNSPTIEGVTCLSDDVDFGEYYMKGKSLVPSSAPGFGMKLLKKQ